MTARTITIEFEGNTPPLQIEFDAQRGTRVNGLMPSKSLVPSLVLKPSKGYRKANATIKIEWDRGNNI